MKRNSAQRSVANVVDSAARLDTQVCFALYSTMLVLNKTYRRVLKDIGLTYPQYLVMLVLWENDGLTASSIAERLYLEPPTLTPLLKRLEVMGLVDRVRSSKDERQLVVTLTVAGRRTQSKARAVPDCIAEAMECTPRALEVLHARLVDLRTALKRTT